MAHPSEQDTELNDLVSIVITQLSIKQGIKRFGIEGEDAVQTEMKQRHDRAVLKPVVASQLSQYEKKASLQYLMFLKQKRIGFVRKLKSSDNYRAYTVSGSGRNRGFNRNHGPGGCRSK